MAKNWTNNLALWSHWRQHNRSRARSNLFKILGRYNFEAFCSRSRWLQRGKRREIKRKEKRKKAAKNESTKTQIELNTFCTSNSGRRQCLLFNFSCYLRNNSRQNTNSTIGGSRNNEREKIVRSTGCRCDVDVAFCSERNICSWIFQMQIKKDLFEGKLAVGGGMTPYRSPDGITADWIENEKISDDVSIPGKDMALHNWRHLLLLLLQHTNDISAQKFD